MKPTARRAERRAQAAAVQGRSCRSPVAGPPASVQPACLPPWPPPPAAVPAEPDFDERLTLAAPTDRPGGNRSRQPPASSALTMPNGIKPVDPLDSLSPVGSAYRSSGGQPGTCKYWILDLGTRLPAPAPGLPSRWRWGDAVCPSEMCVICCLLCERGLCGDGLWGPLRTGRCSGQRQAGCWGVRHSECLLLMIPFFL